MKLRKPPKEPMTSLPVIYKTREMIDVEARYGYDVRKVLVDLYNALGSQAAVAREIGVSQPTIDNWFERLGIVVTVTTVATIGQPSTPAPVA